MCLDCSCGHPPVAAAPSFTVAVEQALLGRNDQQAEANRARFDAAGVTALNLLSSPGSGKTALLERLSRDWGSRVPMAAVVGDLATDNDARRLAAAGLPAVQITTGQACHLEAAMVARALEQLPLEGVRLLLIENVGNLVCPAAYDLGEHLRVVLVAVTEGEDKPLKYPATFVGADLVLITKVDLAAAVEADLGALHRHIARVAPGVPVLEVSARTGRGLEALVAFCRGRLLQADGVPA
ncbi:MAG: hydrogenase nickel incorporation protein HypB [Prochlorococcaceae cyanobacterium]|jgi:hydrogenase nickel incorporation protein HypB